jgi:hypothetical protein
MLPGLYLYPDYVADCRIPYCNALVVFGQTPAPKVSPGVNRTTASLKEQKSRTPV